MLLLLLSLLLQLLLLLLLLLQLLSLLLLLLSLLLLLLLRLLQISTGSSSEKLHSNFATLYFYTLVKMKVLFIRLCVTAASQ